MEEGDASREGGEGRKIRKWGSGEDRGGEWGGGGGDMDQRYTREKNSRMKNSSVSCARFWLCVICRGLMRNDTFLITVDYY